VARHLDPAVTGAGGDQTDIRRTRRRLHEGPAMASHTELLCREGRRRLLEEAWSAWMMQSGSAAGDLWSEATVLPLALMGPLELVGFLFV
jgi:hypothetical protein